MAVRGKYLAVGVITHRHHRITRDVLVRIKTERFFHGLILMIVGLKLKAGQRHFSHISRSRACALVVPGKV